MRIKIFNLEFVTPPFQRTYDGYENESVELLEYIPKNYPIIELGGSIGVVSCVLNKMLDNPKNHIVIEANPHLIQYTEENKRINNCSFEIFNKIFSYGDGTFHIDKSFVSSSEKRKGSPTITETAQISPITLRALVQKPSILVCDIEGTEIDLIRNEMDIIKNNIVDIHIEFHPRITGKMAIRLAILKLWLNGFRTVKRINKNYVFHNKSFKKMA